MTYTEAVSTALLNAQYRDSENHYVRDTHLEPLWCLG